MTVVAAYLYRHGKRAGRPRSKWLGVALMFYPYAVAQTWLLYVVGVALCVGVFIDRPLGYGKPAAEPDQTPLLAHEAFSPALAQRRWNELQRFGQEVQTPLPAWVVAGTLVAAAAFAIILDFVKVPVFRRLRIT